MNNLQSWNNILSYIKLNLGVPLNMIEMTDDDIVTYLSENTLVEFSNYVPKIKYYLLTDADLVDISIYKYQINVSDYIIDVTNVYTYSTQYIGDISTYTSSNEIIKKVINNKFSDMVKLLNTVITYRFEQPNYLIFYTEEISSFLPVVVEYNTVYDNLDEIPADMYQLFKKLCLADIKILIGNMRTKYQLSTPFGQIMNNGDTLKQEGEQLRQLVLENLKILPPDKLVIFVN